MGGGGRGPGAPWGPPTSHSLENQKGLPARGGLPKKYYPEALPGPGVGPVVFPLSLEEKAKTLATLDKLAAAVRQTG